MAVRPVVPLFLLCLAVSVVNALHSANKTAEEGENITLICRAADPESVTAVEWNRNDSDTEHVLLYKRGQKDPDGQDPSYRGWVYLVDPQMKDGDVSLVLKNVRVSDTGVYECRLERGSLELEAIYSINLKVLPRGTKEELKKDRGTKDGEKKDRGSKDGEKKYGRTNDGEKKDGGSKDGEKNDGWTIGLAVFVGVLLIFSIVYFYLVYL